jgi:hypothetical protein
MTALAPPTVLDCGAEVLDFTLLHPGGNGWVPHGVVLARWHAEFVTWVVALRDGTWHPEAGHYYRGDTAPLDALDDYRKRVDR